MHRIPVIRFHFPLDALHVSDYVSPSSGATFYKLYIAFAIATQQIDVWYRHNLMRCTAYKVTPEDGLIQSETCRASNGK